MNWYILKKEQLTLQWSASKNQHLKETRGLSFEMVEEAIQNGDLVDIMAHPNQEKYPHQHMLTVVISGYSRCVPCVIDGVNVFLKTVYPSRKAMKKEATK